MCKRIGLLALIPLVLVGAGAAYLSKAAATAEPVATAKILILAKTPIEKPSDGDLVANQIAILRSQDIAERAVRQRRLKDVTGFGTEGDWVKVQKALVVERESP